MSWLTHVKKTMKDEKDKKATMGKKWFSHVLKTAKKSYKKHKKGGEDPEPNEVNATNVPENVPETNATGGRGKKTRRRGGRKH